MGGVKHEAQSSQERATSIRQPYQADNEQPVNPFIWLPGAENASTPESLNF